MNEFNPQAFETVFNPRLATSESIAIQAGLVRSVQQDRAKIAEVLGTDQFVLILQGTAALGNATDSLRTEAGEVIPPSDVDLILLYGNPNHFSFAEHGGMAIEDTEFIPGVEESKLEEQKAELVLQLNEMRIKAQMSAMIRPYVSQEISVMVINISEFTNFLSNVLPRLQRQSPPERQELMQYSLQYGKGYAFSEQLLATLICPYIDGSEDQQFLASFRESILQLLQRYPEAGVLYWDAMERIFQHDYVGYGVEKPFPNPATKRAAIVRPLRVRYAQELVDRETQREDQAEVKRLRSLRRQATLPSFAQAATILQHPHSL